MEQEETASGAARQRRVALWLGVSALLALVPTGGSLYFLLFKVPRFMQVFSNLGMDLPWPTILTLRLSLLFQHYPIAGGIAVLLVAFLTVLPCIVSSCRRKRPALWTLALPALTFLLFWGAARQMIALPIQQMLRPLSGPAPEVPSLEEFLAQHEKNP